MQRQPKARSTKSTARIKQFYELTAKARNVPQAEVSVDFDNETKMKRQVRRSANLGTTASFAAEASRGADGAVSC